MGTSCWITATLRRRSFVLASALAFCLPAAVAQAVVLSPTSAPLSGSSFQGGDGDQTNSAPFGDWQALAASPNLVAVGDPDLNDSVISGKENEPVDWDLSVEAGGSSPGKSNFFASWNNVDNDTFLYLAFEREASGGGNAFLAFELNQDPRLWTNANGDQIPCRTDGDLIISYEIQSGSNIEIFAQEWGSTSSVTAAEALAQYTNGEGCAKTGTFIETDPGSANAQAAINAATITNFLPGATGATIGAGLFGEAALRIDAVLNPSGTDPCFSFGQISMHSRTAKSVSSGLTDYIAPVRAVVRSCTISGFKFDDLDADGTKDAGEPPIEGYKLYLDLDNDGLLGLGEPTELTDANGEYVFEDVATGSHVIREAPDSAQSAANQGYVCTSPTPCQHSATITAGVKNDVGNDFLNVKPGTITIRKETAPDEPANTSSFGFTSNIPGAGNSAFNLTDDQAWGPISVTPGTYSASENDPSGLGYSFKDLSCTESGGSSSANSVQAAVPTRTASIIVESGENVVCTFHNDKDAQLTVVKDADPESSQAFEINATGSGLPATLNLIDDGSATDTQSFTFGSGQFGSKSLNESVPAGWTLESANCTGANDTDPATNGVTLDIQPGDDITCTFVDTQDASLTIVKQADPEGPTSFDFDATGNGIPANIDLVDDGTNANTASFTLDAGELGAHTFTENVPNGWTLTARGCEDDQGNPVGSQIANGVAITVNAGDDISCTFTDVQDATVTYRKLTDPATDPQDFAFTTTGSGLSNDTLDTDPGSAGTPSSHSDTLDATELAGTKTIAENVPNGWTLSSADCTGTTETPIANGVSFTVNAGDTIVCTFTNTKDAQLTIVKQADPEGPTSFDFDATGNGIPASFDLTDDGSAANTQSFTLESSELGTKTVTENVPQGWTLDSASCNNSGSPIANGVSIDVDAGDDITCTFVDTQDASLTIVKQADPEGPTSFDFDATGNGIPASFDLTDDGSAANTQSFTLESSELGTKTVTENVPQGWTLDSASCNNSGSPIANGVSIDVDAGDDITCTFVDAQDATVTILKNVEPLNAPQDFHFTTTGGGLSDFDLDDNGDLTDSPPNQLPKSKTFTITARDGFGQKTVTEQVPNNWQQSNLVCTEGQTQGSTATLQVDPSDQITCTYTNRQNATVTVIKDADPNSAQDFHYTTAGGGLADFDLDDDADNTLANGRTFTITNADGFGQKTVSEQSPAGWSQSNLVCSEGNTQGSTATVQVDPGDQITCTYTNKQDATVTITAVSQPDSPSSFEFAATGGGLPQSFTLDDDGDATNALSDSRTFTITNADGFGQKSVTEQLPENWVSDGVQCNEGAVENLTATLAVDPGDQIVCIFTARNVGVREQQAPLVRKIDYSLRFRYSDKHGKTFVIARVYCHSAACVLSATGSVTILPYDAGKRMTRIKTIELSPVQGSSAYTRGRTEAGALKFKVPPAGARAVQNAALHHAEQGVRASIDVQGVNTLQPDLNLRRFRNIILFAGPRHPDQF